MEWTEEGAQEGSRKEEARGEGKRMIGRGRSRAGAAADGDDA